MARRKKVLPFPAQGASTKPLAVAPIHDHARLLLERFLASQEAIIANANAASDTFVRTLMRLDEIDPEQGWMFNRQKMRWEKYPVPTDA